MSSCKHCNPLNCAPDLCGARPKAPTITPRPPTLKAGDLIIISSVAGVCPRWWQFWRRKPKSQLFIWEHK